MGQLGPQAAGTLLFLVGDEHRVMMAPHLTPFSSVGVHHRAFPDPERWKNSLPSLIVFLLFSS